MIGLYRRVVHGAILQPNSDVQQSLCLKEKYYVHFEVHNFLRDRGASVGALTFYKHKNL